MLAAEGEVPGSGKRLERRAFKACHHCSLGKRLCENARPCSSCCFRQLECMEAAKDETCSACKKRKVKCDKQRPCGRCWRAGLAAECRSWLSLADEEVNSRVRRRPDAEDEPLASDDSSESRARSDKRPRLVPTLALMKRGSPSRNSNATSPITSADQRVTGESYRSPCALSVARLSPERPVSFPDDPFPSWSQVLSHSSKNWPRTLLFAFKALRSSDHIYERVLANMTPKLLSTIVRVFRACDDLFASSGSLPTLPEPPKDWALQNRLWKNSNRCGRQTVRFDRSFGVISGLDVNPFWSDLAGLHREEFIARAFSGENLFPTSELRQTCKLFKFHRDLMEAHLQTTRTGSKVAIPAKPTYMRWSRDWGRHDRGAGVLLRMNVTSTLDPENQWVYLQQTAVEVTAEEYEAARAQDPQACEGYMIPVVGSKSAGELLAPTLAEEESFAFLNSHPAGRDTLDRFADSIESDFAFVYQALHDIRSGNHSALPAPQPQPQPQAPPPAPPNTLPTAPRSPPLAPQRWAS